MLIPTEQIDIGELLQDELDGNVPDNIDRFDSLQRILEINQRRGRIRSFTQGDDNLIPAYIQKVALNYQENHFYVEGLQAHRDNQLWKSLIEKLRLWAYNFIINKGFYPGEDTYITACDYATEAVPVLLEAHFPYDTEFDSWARVIMINVCRRQMRNSQKASLIPDTKLVPIDEVLIPDMGNLSSTCSDQRMDLLQAILKLRPNRRMVIFEKYFYGFSTQDISLKMGKSVGAIHSLHFQALKDLRKILGENGHNDV